MIRQNLQAQERRTGAVLRGQTSKNCVRLVVGLNKMPSRDALMLWPLSVCRTLRAFFMDFTLAGDMPHVIYFCRSMCV